jgi:hypothetical protein
VALEGPVVGSAIMQFHDGNLVRARRPRSRFSDLYLTSPYLTPR